MRTKAGSIIRVCNGHSLERAKQIGNGKLLDNSRAVFMTYIGSNLLTVKKIIKEDGRLVAVTTGGGYFPSWILVKA